jgi:hypothetical protein
MRIQRSWTLVNSFRRTKCTKIENGNWRLFSTWLRRQYAPLKRRSIGNRLHGAIAENIPNLLLVAVRTWNLAKSIRVGPLLSLLSLLSLTNVNLICCSWSFNLLHGVTEWDCQNAARCFSTGACCHCFVTTYSILHAYYTVYCTLYSREWFIISHYPVTQYALAGKFVVSVRLYATIFTLTSGG